MTATSGVAVPANDSRAPLTPDRAGAAFRHYTYYRPTILVLLKERESHGYELASRMADLGFDHRLAASLYGVLRDMEIEGLIASSWDLSGSGGPPRRVYAITASGDQFLRDSVPMLVRQRRALDAMLHLYGDLDKAPAATTATGAQARMLKLHRKKPGTTGSRASP